MTLELTGRSTADVMLADPKTVAGDASVADVRALLANPSVLMVLLADGDEFRGALTELPADAPDDAPALAYADTAPDALSPDDPAATAFDRAMNAPSRRMVVLDGDRLVGLVCLNADRTRFCGRPSA